MVWTLPNILTVSRIALTPLIAVLPFFDGYVPKLLAFLVFLAAAISDIYDGRIARERGEISDLGKLLDPAADKLLLFACLVPIYWMTRSVPGYAIPWWGHVPLVVAALFVARELAITLLRQVARRRGIVIAADWTGKIKTIVQDIFLGAALAWFAWQDIRVRFAWEPGWVDTGWNAVHGVVVSVTLAVALGLTVFSMGGYLYRYRGLFRPPTATPGAGNGR